MKFCPQGGLDSVTPSRAAASTVHNPQRNPNHHPPRTSGTLSSRVSQLSQDPTCPPSKTKTAPLRGDNLHRPNSRAKRALGSRNSLLRRQLTERRETRRQRPRRAHSTRREACRPVFSCRRPQRCPRRSRRPPTPPRPRTPCTAPPAAGPRHRCVSRRSRDGDRRGCRRRWGVSG